jgi:hypothetical protein
MGQLDQLPLPLPLRPCEPACDQERVSVSDPTAQAGACSGSPE